jgi:hypothetical protein
MDQEDKLAHLPEFEKIHAHKMFQFAKTNI